MQPQLQTAQIHAQYWAQQSYHQNQPSGERGDFPDGPLWNEHLDHGEQHGDYHNRGKPLLNRVHHGITAATEE